MGRHRPLRARALLLLLTLAGTGCAGDVVRYHDAAGSGPTAGGSVPVPGRGTTTGLTKDTITLGIFYPRTGFYAGIFRNAAALFQAAADEAGLINGRRLVLKFYDDGSANASTIQVEEKRAKDEAFSYMSLVSESNVVLAPLADQHKIPIVFVNVDETVG